MFASGFIKRPALPHSQILKHSRNGRSLSIAIKATVFAAAASGVISLNDQLTQHTNGPSFLRCRHIEPPKPIFVDRIEHWDQDNWTVLGAVAGVALASRRPCVLSHLGRPVWYAIHGIEGSFIGNFGFAAWEIRSRGLRDYILGEQNQVAALQRVSYMPEVIRELFLGQINPYEVIGALKKGDIKLSPELIVGLKDRIRPVTEEAVMRARESKTNQIEALFRTPNNSNGPHKTVTPSGESETVPYAERNYDWTPNRAGAVSELSDHIRKLQAQRQQACDEAEAVWDWLSERELEYYKQKARAEAGSEVKGLKTMKTYLETLGKRQLQLWQSVSNCDWMLADAQKQLTLAKSRDSTEALDTPSTSRDDTNVKSVPLTRMVRGLDVALTSTTALVQHTQAELIKNRKLANDANTESNIKPLLNGKISYLEQTLRLLEEHRKSVQRLLEEAIERSQPKGPETPESK